MNAGTLAQLLGMNQQNTQKLTEAWGQAQKASQGVNSLAGARKAIEAVGMTNEAIAKAGALLNSPLAGVVASLVGADIGKAKRALSALTDTSNVINTVSKGAADLSALRAGLRQLKG